jgi:putative SOS response-associated peptidase YedK
MCGRFTARYTWREVHDLYDLTGAARNLQAHYNIAPTDTVEVVRAGDRGNELVLGAASLLRVNTDGR